MLSFKPNGIGSQPGEEKEREEAGCGGGTSLQPKDLGGGGMRSRNSRPSLVTQQV